MLIQAMYPHSFTARVLKWAVYSGLILLLLGRPVRVDNWLNRQLGVLLVSGHNPTLSDKGHLKKSITEVESSH